MLDDNFISARAAQIRKKNQNKCTVRYCGLGMEPTADAGAVPSSRSSLSKCLRAFLILTSVAAEATKIDTE